MCEITTTDAATGECQAGEPQTSSADHRDRKIQVGARISPAPRMASSERAIGERVGAQSDLESLSVILPARNRARLIGPCLESLLRSAATLEPLGVRVEIVVANDASTDETPKVIDRVAKSATIPVRRVDLSTRQGPGRARNAAIEAASGELIVFVDSDVVVEEDFLKAHVIAHQNSGPEIFTVGKLIS